MSVRACVGSMLAATLAAVALAATGCAARPSASRSGPGPIVDRDGRVERVVDGDTIVVDGRRVRLIGIDAPESVDPRRPVACFGRAAARFVTRVLGPGTRVRLVHDVGLRDRFGRELAYVYRLPDLLFINAALVREGYATPLTIAPDVAHAAQFVRLAARGRALGLGLWRACPPPGSEAG
jgi:micrococcal nuclease